MLAVVDGNSDFAGLVLGRGRLKLRKKEAARRRPESREETPKEGMYGKHRTSNILAPIPTNARSQYRF
jgi:hypothetical protein